MAEDASGTVRVCLTRCPLPPAEERVHSMPCRIHFDGKAAVKTYFHPETGAANSNSTNHGTGSEQREKDTATAREEATAADDDGAIRAEFRGIQLQGQKLQLAPMGFTGLVLEDSGMRHPTDEGRIWEVEDHFNVITWW
ncbi:hypothetical protein BBJ29_001007 [Phytophthora kernoviae]|uniref:Uncharacterized protein n=1 Tax=Phytophthora kernoviae TaxID=325452 RepID=A0A3R7GMV4_9STRA|nr:hypothetical protein BBJ29_001007 [Phytophthora kernoviae]